ncbi:MAG: hypothetical protein ACR65W_07500 [Methylocystis sp.]|uniref:hypothetical protein n=1 Tax=Methylocystis sp. TaxID=1911079 RepID=UPI003DA356FC
MRSQPESMNDALRRSYQLIGFKHVQRCQSELVFRIDGGYESVSGSGTCSAVAARLPFVDWASENRMR